MEDKEVGDLWRYWREFEGGTSAAADVCRVICKLVEERRERLYMDGFELICLEKALKDFGIDPDTFK